MKRFISRSICVVLAGFILGVAAGEASASLITYNLHGAVDTVNPAISGFSVGDEIDLSYSFESTTAARAGSNSNFAVFDALTNLNFSIGSYSASSSGAPELQVDNDPGLPNHDRYGLASRASDGLTGPPVSTVLPLGSAFLDSFLFRFDDPSDTVFNDALILPTDLHFDDFASNRFFVFFTTNIGGINISLDGLEGTFDSLRRVDEPVVPEPTTLSLIALGLGAGCLRRRKAAA